MKHDFHNFKEGCLDRDGVGRDDLEAASWSIVPSQIGATNPGMVSKRPLLAVRASVHL